MFKSTLHYDAWPRLLKYGVDLSWSCSSDLRPWPQWFINHYFLVVTSHKCKTPSLTKVSHLLCPWCGIYFLQSNVVVRIMTIESIYLTWLRMVWRRKHHLNPYVIHYAHNIHVIKYQIGTPSMYVDDCVLHQHCSILSRVGLTPFCDLCCPSPIL